jgi:hypothetical protein
MSKSVNGDVEGDLVKVLGKIECAEQELWYVLIAGNWSGGCGDEGGAYVMSRCLMEVVHGHTFDAEGRFVSVPDSGSGKSTATAQRVRGRVRQALREGRRAGAEFVICYHVEGDPGWYMEWSEAHSRKSAVEAVKQYLKYRMLWEELWE